MECGWLILVALLLHTSTQGTLVFCQNVATENVARERRDCSRSSGSPTSADLFNSLLTVAASNGVLPDLLPMLQGQSVADSLQRSPYGQDVLTKPLSVTPMPPGCGMQEQIIYSGQTLMPPTQSQNVIITPLPYGPSGQLNVVPGAPQTFPSPALPNCVSQIAQSMPLENYPMCAQNAGTGRPTPIILQPQCQLNDVKPYNIYNQIHEPIPLLDMNPQPLNLPIMPAPQVLPSINTCSGILELTPNLAPNQNCLSNYQTKPTVLTTDGQQVPLNLQINVPTPNMPAPKITVVSTTPPNTPVSSPSSYCPDYSTAVPPFQCPPQPPIVIGGSSRSSLRNLLPILLVAMFSDRGSNNGGGCCCCCHSCNNGNSGNSIPIPYPIPIPINNPIVNTCTCSSLHRNRGYVDDEDDDEDRR